MAKFKLYHNECGKEFAGELTLMSINRVEDTNKVSHVYRCDYCGFHTTLIIEE